MSKAETPRASEVVEETGVPAPFSEEEILLLPRRMPPVTQSAAQTMRVSQGHAEEVSQYPTSHMRPAPYAAATRNSADARFAAPLGTPWPLATSCAAIAPVCFPA